MSDTWHIIVGIALTLMGVLWLIASLPRGKKAWFVGVPFAESGAPILIIAMFPLGLILIAAYFTIIDDATLSGVVKHL